MAKSRLSPVDETADTCGSRLVRLPEPVEASSSTPAGAVLRATVRRARLRKAPRNAGGLLSCAPAACAPAGHPPRLVVIRRAVTFVVFWGAVALPAPSCGPTSMSGSAIDVS